MIDQSLKNILFLDIETVGCVDSYAKLSDDLKTQWEKKANFFKQQKEQPDEELFYQKAGIYAEFGKIIVIAVGKYIEDEDGKIGLKTTYFADDEENKVLNSFKTLLEKMNPATQLCAHNGKEFDFPYISRRMLVNEIKLPSLLNLSGKKPWEIPHLDTMELWKFGDYKHYTSLDLLATIFNIPSSKGSMDGSMVNAAYYQEKKLSTIAEYCVRDVIVVAQLYLKMKGLEMIPEKNIKRT